MFAHGLICSAHSVAAVFVEFQIAAGASCSRCRSDQVEAWKEQRCSMELVVHQPLHL